MSRNYQTHRAMTAMNTLAYRMYAEGFTRADWLAMWDEAVAGAPDYVHRAHSENQPRTIEDGGA